MEDQRVKITHSLFIDDFLKIYQENHQNLKL